MNELELPCKSNSIDKMYVANHPHCGGVNIAMYDGDWNSLSSLLLDYQEVPKLITYLQESIKGKTVDK
jgi:hypothetical protein